MSNIVDIHDRAEMNFAQWATMERQRSRNTFDAVRNDRTTVAVDIKHRCGVWVVHRPVGMKRGAVWLVSHAPTGLRMPREWTLRLARKIADRLPQVAPCAVKADFDALLAHQDAIEGVLDNVHMTAHWVRGR